MDPVSFYSQFLTPRRQKLLREKILYRTRYVSLALEDIFQTHNASAILRTCDCFGIQDVHLLEGRNPYEINEQVSMGSSRWMSLHRYQGEEASPERVIAGLRQKGYRIVATTPHTRDVALQDFDPFYGPFVLFFGTELQGLSLEVIRMADEHIRIPMVGFTESLNVSVSVGIVLHHIMLKLRSSDHPIGLSLEEEQEILLTWLKNSVKRSDLLDQYLESEKAKAH